MFTYLKKDYSVIEIGFGSILENDHNTASICRRETCRDSHIEYEIVVVTGFTVSDDFATFGDVFDYLQDNGYKLVRKLTSGIYKLTKTDKITKDITVCVVKVSNISNKLIASNNLYSNSLGWDIFEMANDYDLKFESISDTTDFE